MRLPLLPTALRAGFRRAKFPFDLRQLPELPDFLRTAAPTCPVPAAPPGVITRSMQDVLRAVTRIAAAGGAMPNNPELGQMAGGRGRSSALRALRRLHAAGKLAVEHQGSRRRVVILGSGARTEWGEARPGHSPFIRRDRGEPPPPRNKARAPNTRPLAPQLPEGVHYVPPIVIGNAATCQWPMWEDGAKPGRHALFCCNAVCDDTSFCEEHVHRVYKNRKQSTQPKNTGVGKTVEVLRDPRFADAIVGYTDPS